MNTQPNLPGINPDEVAEIKAGYVWRAELYSAIRTAIEHLGGYEIAGRELNERWKPTGRPVTGAYLRACLADGERNNFRAEWLDYFAVRSLEVADILGRRVKPTKTDAQDRDDIIAAMRSLLGHQLVEMLLCKARAM